MYEFLPEAVRKGLDDARKAAQKRSSRLCVHDGDKVFRVLRMWDGGFAMDIEDAPQLRGHVELFDGARHLYQCLVIASERQGSEMHFEFKWHTPVLDHAPVDYEVVRETPVALLPR